MSDIKNKIDLEQGVEVITSLPFNFHLANGAAKNNFSSHNQLAFDIADAFSTASNTESRDTTTQYKALEHKLTTILHLLRFLLASQQVVATEYQIKLSALTVEWDNAGLVENKIDNIKKHQQLVFEFYPSNQLPWPIKRLGQVTEVNGSVINAAFLPLDSTNDERFAKWVFQLHRRSIQQQKI
ncbi:hypothetical protein MNBD_GAMMA23-941 [hydrothermal vent metagenome]|uniref:Cyclic di-GMP receptor atypical PilZ domain-containing protein n=1 Tax=hydrothermal vent metagenome TaxID=652676 RepID=A0A3B1A0C3_9ZZZZ